MNAATLEQVETQATETVDVEPTQVESTEESSPAAAAGKYPAQVVRDEVAALVASWREAGFTRPQLTELTGFGGSALWRAEKGNVHRTEVATYDELADRIAAGDVQPPRKPGKVDPTQERVDAAVALVDALTDKATKADLRAALDAVRATLVAEVPDASQGGDDASGDESPAEATQEA